MLKATIGRQYADTPSMMLSEDEHSWLSTMRIGANVCRRFRDGGVDAVLHDKRQEKRCQALTGEQVAIW